METKEWEHIFNIVVEKSLNVYHRYPPRSFVYEIDDLVSESATSVFCKWEQFSSSKGDLGGWIYRIVKNKWVDMNRSIHNSSSRVDLFYLISNKESLFLSCDAIESSEGCEQIMETIYGLTNELQRTSLLLSIIGYDNKEIARITGRKYEDVTLAICRAKKKVRIKLTSIDNTNDVSSTKTY